MEEVDNIIIHTLREIGCGLDDDVQSLKHFSTENIVEATVKCLRVIGDGVNISPALPPGMSARYRVGTQLATSCQELGFRGDIGYQTFLYSNEADIRRVLMFLIEKMPKEAAEVASEPMGKSAMLKRSIAAELDRQMKSAWTPSYCKQDGLCWRGTKPRQWHREGLIGVRRFHSCPVRTPEGVGDITKKIPKDLKRYYDKHLQPLTSQPPQSSQVVPSVVEANDLSVTAQQEWEAEWNQQGLPSRLSEEDYKARKRQRLEKRISDQLRQAIQQETSKATAGRDLLQVLSSFTDRGAGKGVTKGSRFTHTEKLQFAQDEETAAQMMGEGPRVDTEEEMQRKREEEVEQLRGQLEEVTGQLQSLDVEMKKFTAGIQQMEEKVNTEVRGRSDKEEAYKVKKRTLDLLPDAENNITKLQGVVDGSSQRLVNLAQQWEKHRVPLIQQYRELKELNANRESQSEKKLEEIKSLREKMKEVADEARGKDDVYKQLASEYERMTKDVNRGAYTKRIMEIVGNIKKQKEEIDKILIDTRDVQKEINQLTGKLDRTFAVTDELIFRDAKKDEAVRKAYKSLAALHENCEQLIKTVEETGGIMREIRDLEDQIETEGAKKTTQNLDRIMGDFKQMKQENSGIVAKLKGK
ncbi:coiled-coil domain-containing protein 22 homolog [Branchiostoma floridae]|uniref:Coiled-coil domain-containing protein 22 n=1 Tax=Branchiostoma floridae TaxID=7739 RepID=A0A9J7LFC3_BRAFL|nr:coiled-coil domain-containing protein 22 homolog [Branchiostoma floridae]